MAEKKDKAEPQQAAAEEQAAVEQQAVERRLDEAEQPGGVYIVNKRRVNADGEPL